MGRCRLHRCHSRRWRCFVSCGPFCRGIHRSHLARSTQSNDITLDDGATSNITYSAGWDSSPNGMENYYFLGTMQYVCRCHLARRTIIHFLPSRTNTPDASATISFYGDAITVYGATAANHGVFSVQVDGGDPHILNGSAPDWRYQNTLVRYAACPSK